ncbi:MAG: hypothetical protein K6E47_08760 [Lachnospiraceae bacterium]|nr:hypothetical protein [Lachnospiraceae bacterium]
MGGRFTDLIQGINPFRNKELNNDTKYDKVTYRVFKCPECGQLLRVPKGSGRVEITCRRCGKVFEAKS